MLDIYHMCTEIVSLPGITDLFQFIVPMAGVGGGIEAKEHVDLIPLIRSTSIFLVGIGILFGFGLAFAAKKFSVKTDPRVERVKDILAQAHCGACGYAGCEQYAEAVVNNPDVPPDLCRPGGQHTSEAVASITGKKADLREPLFSRIMCRGGWERSSKKFTYEGIQDCRAVILAGGGDKACRYGCLGYGTCMKACPFDAITMNGDHLPSVDISKCTGCKKCETACPTKVIVVLPGSQQVFVTCHSKDKGSATRGICRVGCIACGTCVKICPFDAPSLENNLARIDPDKCRLCGLCVGKCPTHSITDFLPERPKAVINDTCIGCQTCARVCPVNASSGIPKKQHSIDPSQCIGCGVCTAKCPVLAIDGTFNVKEIHAARTKKKSIAA